VKRFARLKARQEARRDPVKAAAQGLHWGGPVLESAITLIHDGALYYRGRDAIALADSATAEAVAALLWNAPAIETAGIFDQPCPLSPRRIAQLRACAEEPFALLQAALPVAAITDLASFDLRPAAVRHTGGRIVRLFATLLLGRPAREPLHRCLQQAVGAEPARGR
jgi:citrate synthase